MSRTLDAKTIVAAATQPLVVGETVDLTGLEIREPLDLRRRIIGNVDFSGSRFLAPLEAAGATFAGLAWFRRCEFRAHASFADCVFENDLRLDDARVTGKLDIGGSELRGIGCFDRSHFAGPARFDRAKILGNLSLSGSRFGGTLSFREVECLGGLWLDGARLDGGADFGASEVHGRTWLGTNASREPTKALISYGYVYTRAG